MNILQNAIRMAFITLIPALLLTCHTKQEIFHLPFNGEVAEHVLVLNEMKPALPTDWSTYSYLVMEMKVTSPQRFSVKAYTPEGMCRILIQPVGQNVWFRAVIPLQYFRGRDSSGHDMASANNRPRNAFWMSVWGPFGNIDRVDSLGINMTHPVGNPMVTIRSIVVSREDPGSEIMDALPVIDSLGQWMNTDEARKVQSFEQLKTAWEEEDQLLGDGFDYCEFGGYTDMLVKGTGHFRIEQIDSVWWFVDPHGHLFLSTGPDVLRNEQATRISGRESYYQALPDGPDDELRQSYREQTVTSFYTWNLKRRFGESWEAKWADLVLRRLDAWGMNTIACWSTYMDETHKKTYTVWLSGWSDGIPTYLGMPDVYSKAFADQVDSLARENCTPLKNDPYVLGYFIGNEPPWPDRESELADLFLNGPENTTRQKLEEFLATEDSPERRREFFINAFEKYLTLICDAIRKYDPNHLNLGIRFGGSPPLDVIRLGGMFDVYSLNVYNERPVEAIQKAYQNNGGRPVIIGEFHFGVPAGGLGAGLVQARDQKERGVAYRYYMEQAAAEPAFVGAHWFQWVDQPVSGRFDGENYNIGLVDVTDRPYWEFLEGVKETHRNLYSVHAGMNPPASEKAKKR